LSLHVHSIVLTIAQARTGNVTYLKLPMRLIGMAIGKVTDLYDFLSFMTPEQKGVNIKEAQTIEGVSNIELQMDSDKSGTFRIYAKTVEAAERAKIMLTVTETYFDVPLLVAIMYVANMLNIGRSCIARIIGSKGRNVEKIIQNSGVFRILGKKTDEKSGFSKLVIVGRQVRHRATIVFH